MTTVWDRRNPRVSYQVPVGVLDPEHQRLLNMISINLSRGGMFVDTPEELAIGKVLVCNVPIGDYAAMQVRGRVAWQRPQSVCDEQHPRGVGIEFIDLSLAESTQLDQIVGDQEDLSHGVRLHVEGMQGAINAQAQLTPQGIFFRSSLPFLRLNSQVDFAFDDDNGKESYQGRIVDVKVHRDLESSIPRLQVEVELLSMGHDENEIPCGIGSDAVYEVMHVDRDDTERTAVDQAVENAIDDTIHDAMHAMDRGEPAFVRNRPRQSVDVRFEDARLENHTVLNKNLALETREDPETEMALEARDDLENDEDLDNDEGLENDEDLEGDEDLDNDEMEEDECRASDSDPIILVMPKRIPRVSDDVVDDFVEDASDRLQVVGRGKRLLLSVAAVAGLLLIVLWASRSSSDEQASEAPAETGSILPVANASEAERIRAIIEGPELAPNHDEALEANDEGLSDSRQLATGGPELAAQPSPPSKPAAPKAAVKKQVAVKPAPAKPSQVREQRLGGIKMREDSKTLVVRIPIKGTLEQAKSYLLADPPGLAINLPYAQPIDGYHESLTPESDAIRLVWVRERLGGLHFRMFFEGSAPTCKTDFGNKQVTVTCER